MRGEEGPPAHFPRRPLIGLAGFPRMAWGGALSCSYRRFKNKNDKALTLATWLASLPVGRGRRDGREEVRECNVHVFEGVFRWL